MFHCNGWCFPWTMAAAAGINVCLRKVDPAKIFELIPKHGVTHMCGAPIVYTTLINAPDAAEGQERKSVVGLIAGAAPPVAVIEGAESIGISLTHVYGLTEVYGPASVCAEQPGWDDLPVAERASSSGGRAWPIRCRKPSPCSIRETMKQVPRDGETIGEVMFRGNIVMKGYLKNEKATKEAFAGGWFHTGDLGVLDEHGYVIIKDRSKDIIISGGENISSVEVEDVLYKHPAVLFAAVVAKPDPKWGEVPCAFIELKDGAKATEAEIIAYCRGHMSGFKTPKAVVFGPMPKTSTGKIQKFLLRNEVQSAKAISAWEDFAAACPAAALRRRRSHKGSSKKKKGLGMKSLHIVPLLSCVVAGLLGLARAPGPRTLPRTALSSISWSSRPASMTARRPARRRTSCPIRPGRSRCRTAGCSDRSAASMSTATTTSGSTTARAR